MNYILETNHLSKQSGNTYRVNDLSMAVPENCVYGFLGPNGAGKSTTLKMILGQHQNLWKGHEFRKQAVYSQANGEPD